MILDAGVFVLAEKNPSRCVALMQRFPNEPMRSNENVLAQVWRKPHEQVLLKRFVKLNHIVIEPITSGKAIGVLLEKSGTTDVVDASVALMALSYNDVVLTSDPEDLQKLGATVVAI